MSSFKCFLKAGPFQYPDGKEPSRPHLNMYWACKLKVFGCPLFGFLFLKCLWFQASLVQLFDTSGAKVVDLLKHLIIQNISTLKLV